MDLDFNEIKDRNKRMRLHAIPSLLFLNNLGSKLEDLGGQRPQS